MVNAAGLDTDRVIFELSGLGAVTGKVFLVVRRPRREHVMPADVWAEARCGLSIPWGKGCPIELRPRRTAPGALCCAPAADLGRGRAIHPETLTMNETYHLISSVT